jgi:hypothetical protein
VGVAGGYAVARALRRTYRQMSTRTAHDATIKMMRVIGWPM